MFTHTGHPLTCTYCGKEFVNPKTLKSHLRHIHQATTSSAKEKKTDGQTCSYCGKYFQTMAVLREHLKYHTADTRYPCDKCKMKFRLKSSLQLHMQKVHKKPAPTPTTAECPVCSEVIPRKEDLGYHMIDQHPDTEHLCMECGELCGSVNELTQHHQSKHENLGNDTAKKTYTCNMCNHHFTFSRNLVAHIESKHPGKVASIHKMEEQGLVSTKH